MAVVASATGAAVFGLSGVAAGLAGGALLGAGAGALYSGITGDGNILDSALTGALLGGAAGGIGAAFAPAAAGGTGLTAATPLTGAGSLAPTTVSTASPALAATKGSLAASAAAPAGVTATQTAAGLSAIAPGAAPVASTYGTLAGASAPAGLTATQTAAGLGAKTAAAGMTGNQMLAAGLAGTTALSLLGERNQPKLPAQQTQGMIRPYTYSSKPTAAGGEYPSPYPTGPLYDAAGNPILDTRERNYFDQTFTAGEPYKAAKGGLMAAYQSGGPVERMSQMNTAINPQGGMYPQGMIDKTQYALPIQRPTSMEVLDAGAQRMFAKGGQVKGYATGGMPDFGNGSTFPNLPAMSGPLGAVGQAPAGGFNPFSPERMAALNNDPQFREHMRVQGGGRDEQGRTVDGLGNVVERTAPSGQSFGQTMGGLSSMSNQSTLAPTSFGKTAQSGFGQGAQGYPSFSGGSGGAGGAFPLEGQYGIVKMASGGITYDPATQRYSGLPAAASAPAGDSTPLSMSLISELTPQYQAANPNAFSYDPVRQRYGPANPSMMQLNAFKAAQDQKEAEKAAAEAAAAAQSYQSFDGGPGGANGGLMRAYAMGGNVQGYNLGGYSDGGRLLKGPGDGVSDDIPAVIGNRQPARLADGEFVIPARIVSELGNGSTDAGAKRLYAMMDRIQSGRKKTVGKGNVAKDTKAKKHLLA
jgi:hypothetical protein